MINHKSLTKHTNPRKLRRLPPLRDIYYPKTRKFFPTITIRNRQRLRTATSSGGIHNLSDRRRKSVIHSIRDINRVVNETGGIQANTKPFSREVNWTTLTRDFPKLRFHVAPTCLWFCYVFADFAKIFKYYCRLFLR